jgi:hypothetical protein
METYGGVEVYLHAFLNSALHGGKWQASRSSHSTLGERSPATHCIEVLWAPEPVWTRWWREKFSAPGGDRTPVAQPTAYVPGSVIMTLTNRVRGAIIAPRINLNGYDSRWRPTPILCVDTAPHLFLYLIRTFITWRPTYYVTNTTQIKTDLF